MATVNIHEAKMRLSRLLASVERGEDVVIARAGKPIARLVPYAPFAGRKPGTLKRGLRYSDDLSEPLPADLAAIFHGEEP